MNNFQYVNIGYHRPLNPVTGEQYYNPNTNCTELYDGKTWHMITGLNTSDWPENGKCKWQFEQRQEDGYWMAYYSPQGPEMGRVYEWIQQQFGPKDGIDQRWISSGGWIGFRDEKDKNWFLLRWGSA